MDKNIKYNQLVKTPNGEGVIKGVMVSKDEKPEMIQVAHNPKKHQVNDIVKAKYKGGPWVLFYYKPEDIER